MLVVAALTSAHSEELLRMDTNELLDAAGALMHRSEVSSAYAHRHEIHAAPTLTVTSEEIAAAIADRLEPRIRGKTIVDVGGGTGLLAVHLARVARRVFVIEANPIWTAAWLDLYHRRKPKNLSYLFGSASEFVGVVKADVAVVVTHSGLASMMEVAGKLATEVIDVYGEIVASNPAAFDVWAREARLRT
jgi:precorrin-6B methylase 2